LVANQEIQQGEEITISYHKNVETDYFSHEGDNSLVCLCGCNGAEEAPATPLCETCQRQPIIPFNEKEGTRKQQCWRCYRHFIINSSDWPHLRQEDNEMCRIPTQLFELDVTKARYQWSLNANSGMDTYLLAPRLDVNPQKVKEIKEKRRITHSEQLNKWFS
jgi:hypothetical protein